VRRTLMCSRSALMRAGMPALHQGLTQTFRT
jgi:hypothetical protein